MRTTVTLDPDVAARLEELRRRGGRTFKDVVNETLRAGLQAAEEPDANGPVGEPCTIPMPMGLPIVDIADVSAVLALLDDEHVADAPRAAERSG